MASEFKACSVDGCNGNAHPKSRGRKGFCNVHYRRLLRHGDPLTLVKAPNGDVQEYYRNVVLPYDGDECLIWPYALTKGYGHMEKNGKRGIVSRFLCADVYGPPPTKNHEAAHRCGNGHLGCVTKKHLSWKTPKENQSDKIQHGTHNRGERSASSKITESQAIEIFNLKGIKSQREIASEFGVSQQTISDIHCRRTWFSLEL